ncbi:hypothetical protein P9112_009491 [Eukaryota sp. TZLM1-RC]
MRSLFYLFFVLVLSQARSTLDDICTLEPVYDTIVTDAFDVEVVLHPCYNTPLHNANAENCTSRTCLHVFGAEESRWVNVGDNTDVFYSDGNNNPNIHIIGGERCRPNSPDGYSTRIRFFCDDKLDRDRSRLEAGRNFPTSYCYDDKPTIWTFDWYTNSDSVCHSMPFILVALIIIGIAIIGYFALGALYKGVVQGMTGWELIPNIDFWSSLFSRTNQGEPFLTPEA